MSCTPEDEIKGVADEMVRFYGEEARLVAVKNIAKRGATAEWKKMWFQVWKRLPETES